MQRLKNGTLLMVFVFVAQPRQVDKSCDETLELPETLNRLLIDEIPAAVAKDTHSDKPEPVPADRLSERELEILQLIDEGLTNSQIATRLHLVTGTVKAHNHHIFDKLGVSNRVQALVRARELGLL
ncbi:MAG: response regulator transcription factor [Anaerolineae bacterium]|nr:response regulator transcription factor [Anaerolineae bacterium]